MVPHVGIGLLLVLMRSPSHPMGALGARWRHCGRCSHSWALRHTVDLYALAHGDAKEELVDVRPREREKLSEGERSWQLAEELMDHELLIK